VRVPTSPVARGVRRGMLEIVVTERHCTVVLEGEGSRKVRNDYFERGVVEQGRNEENVDVVLLLLLSREDGNGGGGVLPVLGGFLSERHNARQQQQGDEG
jgi:hypothetical protein